MSFDSVPVGRLAEAGLQHQPPGSAGPSERPAAFSVSATWMPEDTHGRRSHGHGSLLIGPGSVTFSPSASMRRRTGADELTHSAGSIRITTTHVAPPWASTHLLLRSGNAAVRVGASMFVRGKLLDALRDAGVTVDEESSPSGATN